MAHSPSRYVREFLIPALAVSDGWINDHSPDGSSAINLHSVIWVHSDIWVGNSNFSDELS